MKPQDELYLSQEDEEWPFTGIDHDRTIVRAIVVDKEGYYYFAHIERDDDFGKAELIETSGGGVEAGEKLEAALHRELKEELGAEVQILTKIGIVSDYYNLIHRHNINHYYLCRVTSFGRRHLTEDEIDSFHLTVRKLSYHEALAAYEESRKTKLGRLISNREVPVLKRAKEILAEKENI